MIKGYNFNWSGVRIDYDTDTSDCTDECSYCSHSRIENTEIRSINVMEMAHDIYSGESSVVNKYCIDRIFALHIKEITNKNNWNIKVGDGYYGEEINGVCLDDDLANIIQGEIDHVTNLKSVEDKINWLLMAEYGFILDELQGKKYRFITVKKSDLTYNQDYRKKIDNKYASQYDEHYKLARGICVKKGDRYRLIDGYHRTSQIAEDKTLILWEAYND